MSSKEVSNLNYVLVTGKGRSGTTWLGQLLNTYEHCSYKYEPFLPSKSTPYSQWRKDLADGNPEELRRRFESLCSHCYHDIDLPPFPDKSFRVQNPQLLYLLYGLGSRIKALKSLYEWYGRPQLNKNTPILIKDVNFSTELLPRFCHVLHPYLIAIIRNPFANIASYFKGVELGLFNQRQEDVKRLHELLKTSGKESLSMYCDRLDTMSDAQLAAVRWRLQVEPLAEYASSYERGLVVVYEDLCLDPQGKIAEIFNVLGWELGNTTQSFIEASTNEEKKPSEASKAYYSVYRNPRESMSKWKKQLTTEQVSDIASVVHDSPLKRLWSDLPV